MCRRIERLGDRFLRRVAILVTLSLTSLATPGLRGDEARPRIRLDARGHLDPRNGRVLAMSFTADGRELISVAEDGSIRFWDVATGDPTRQLHLGLSSENGNPEEFDPDVSVLSHACISPDASSLAVAGASATAGLIRIISLTEGRVVRSLASEDRHEVGPLAFSRDGRFLVAGSAEAYQYEVGYAGVWEVETGRRLHWLRHPGAVASVTFSPDGHWIVTVCGGKGLLWSLKTGRRTAVMCDGETLYAVACGWSPDGRVIATTAAVRGAAANGDALYLWDWNGKALRGVGLPAAEGGSRWSGLQFFEDSSRLVCFRDQPGPAGAVVIGLQARPTMLKFGVPAIEGGLENQSCSALTRDGRLAATSVNNEVVIWEPQGARLIRRLAPLGRKIWALGWSSDGKQIAWGSTRREIKLNARNPLEHAIDLTDFQGVPVPRDVRQGPLMRVGQDPIVFRPDSKGGTLSLGPPGSGKGIGWRRVLGVPNEDGENARLESFSGFGDKLATLEDGWLKIYYGREPGDEVLEVGSHFTAMAPSPDGRSLLASSESGVISLIRLEWLDLGGGGKYHPEVILSLFASGDDWIAWTREGYYACSPGGERLGGWLVNHGPDQLADYYPADRFRKSLYRPDVLTHLLETGSIDRALELADRDRRTVGLRTEVAKVLPPEVEVASPRSGSRLKAEPVEVRAIARAHEGQPITALRVLLDGRPYRGQAAVRPFDPPRSGEVRESWELDLEPGSHRLAVQADSAVSQAVSDAVEVTVAAVGGRRDEIELPALYVLAVGVAAYPGDLRLNFSARDAEAIDRVFRERGAPLFRKVETRLLTDAGATRAEISRGLNWLKGQMTQKDVGVVFFSGHGQRDNEGSLYLLPVDVDTDDLMTSALPDTQLKKALAGMPGRLVLLLDACHAGAVGGDRRKGTRGLTDDLVRDLVTDDYGVIVMASSMGREESQEIVKVRGSAFTVALTEGLEGKADLNKDGAVYLNELDNFVTDRVKELTRGQQHPVTARPTSIRSFPLARIPHD